MKNNRITFTQYCFSSFLASLVCFLFIDYNPSILFYFLIIVALLVDLVVVCFYKGQFSDVLKGLSALFITILSVIVCTEFCRYMHIDLGYSPIWGIMLLVLLFTFFCTVKGLEPLSRASVIISVFVAASIVFIAVSSVGQLKPDIKLFEVKSYIIPIITLFPSAIYILNYDNIIKEKKYSFGIFSIIDLFLLVFFHLFPKSKIAFGVFKGADGALLAVLTVAVIYFIGGSAVSLFKNKKHRYICNAVYLSIIGLLSVLFLIMFIN